MGALKSLLGWAGNAWAAIFGFAGNPVGALQKLWSYITSVHGLLSWLMGNPVTRFWLSSLNVVHNLQVIVNAIVAALLRSTGWIWLHLILPVRTELVNRIIALTAWAVLQFYYANQYTTRCYQAALAYTRQLVGIEQAARIRAVKAEHAAMLAGDKATLATVQREAATAYDAGIHNRLGIAGDLLNDLVTRTPLIKDLVDAVINGALRLSEIDDPVLGWAVKKAIDEIVARTGIDQLAAEGAQSLLAPLTGGGKPADLHAVIAALDARLTAQEANWAEFLKDGGPEVEQAGKEWKALTGPLADVGILAFVGLAAADPAAWSTSVADTLGTTVNAAAAAMVDLIRRA